MTKPRELGNNAKESVNRAAEEITDAIMKLDPIRERNMTRDELLVRIVTASLSLTNALRHLESVGAKRILR